MSCILMYRSLLSVFFYVSEGPDVAEQAVLCSNGYVRGGL